MTNLSPEFCRKIREARRAAKLGQVEVAAEVGCKQSALSSFENGDGTKLNDEVIGKLAKKFKVALETAQADAAQAVPVIVKRVLGQEGEGKVLHRGFCPNPQCPSNHAYEVEGRLLVRPDRSAADPVGGRYCALCGEVLERRCPNCGAPVHEGAICSYCGDPYVAAV